VRVRDDSPVPRALVVVLLALVAAPAAAAHVTIAPDRVAAGSTPILTFAVPN
jgi:hypothetical protein